MATARRLLNVNELNEILEKHFQAKRVFTKRIIAGNHGDPTIVNVGAGRICDIEVEITRAEEKEDAS